MTISMNTPTPQLNLLAQYAKNKLSQRNSKPQSGPSEGSQVSRFPRPVNSSPLAKRGGRNGQGKP